MKKRGRPKTANPISKHYLYHTWQGIIKRCYDASAINYNLYGARGIAVCDRWRSDFWAFVEDMGPRPSPDHSVDRIDNNDHYGPTNCRWATRVEQANNRRQRTCTTATIKGQTRTLKEWQVHFGISSMGKIRNYLDQYRLSPELSVAMALIRVGHADYNACLAKAVEFCKN